MIELYSGTPGSGKSLHVSKKIVERLNRKKPVIANFPINTDFISKKGKRKIGKYIYLSNDKLTVKYLIDYAEQNHIVGKEGQTLVVIDEAGIVFNSRTYSDKLNGCTRQDWLSFFAIHRHYGFNFILVAQHDRMIDRQIRAVLEYEVRHRKANNYRTIGLLFTLVGIKLFVAVEMWYGIKKKVSVEWFTYKKKDSRIYDTMQLFDKRDLQDPTEITINKRDLQKLLTSHNGLVSPVPL